MIKLRRIDQALDIKRSLLGISEHDLRETPDRVGMPKLTCNRCGWLIIDFILLEFDDKRCMECPKAPPKDSPGGEYAKA